MAGSRKYGGLTAATLLAVVLAATGCGDRTDASDEGSKAVVTPLQCGQQFQAPDGGPLTVTGQFPGNAPPDGQSVAGTVEVSSGQSLRGVSLPNADMFLVGDGRVITLPLAQDAVAVPWDLAPGKPKRVPGQVSLLSCASGGGRVAPGYYNLYARVVLTLDDGHTVEAFGGPWPLGVR